jgi:hypothetical protein
VAEFVAVDPVVIVPLQFQAPALCTSEGQSKAAMIVLIIHVRLACQKTAVGRVRAGTIGAKAS